MSLKYLGQVFWVGLLLMSCSGSPDSETSAGQGSPQPAVSKAENSKILTQGTFVSGNYNTQGSATLISSEGKTFLELDQSFQTDQGPDLFVLLHQDAKPETYEPDNYTVVSKLKEIQGGNSMRSLQMQILPSISRLRFGVRSLMLRLAMPH